MNQTDAEKILIRAGYPTSDTIRAFAVKYPALFRSIVKEVMQR